ncbi:MAG: sigma factor-like helix-turn-helix DNA-binding protein [bacterium]|nr:sigma factor-like helix-turn-helix DNA-binding protein [bacterium]
MKTSYDQITLTLLSELPERTREVLGRRFGLLSEKPETLEQIGQGIGITRERVRQIADAGLVQLMALIREEKRHGEANEAFSRLLARLKEVGEVRREDHLLKDVLEKEEEANHVIFLLHVGDPFFHHRETSETHAFWASKEEGISGVLSALHTVKAYFEKRNAAATLEEIAQLYEKKFGGRITPETLASYLEISKHVMQGPEGSWGLKSWPEVNPKGIRDKAYLVVKSSGSPLHFTKVAERIREFQQTFAPSSQKQCLPQTVHNELIKDPRFVLVGRGTYALKEWGYRPGTVRDVITQILKESGKPLSKDDIIKKALSERQVKESTIALNLQNKKYFARDGKGRYLPVS